MSCADCFFPRRYSTRELVSVVKHLERFPGDGLTGALRNVFDFDFHRHEDLQSISSILARFGVALPADLTAYDRSNGGSTLEPLTRVSVGLGRVIRLGATSPAGTWPVSDRLPKQQETANGATRWSRVPWLRNKRTKVHAFPLADEVKLAPLAAKGMANGFVPQTNLRMCVRVCSASVGISCSLCAFVLTLAS